MRDIGGDAKGDVRGDVLGDMSGDVSGRASRRARAAWAQRLHVRAALLAVPLLVALCAAMVLLLRHYSAAAALEAGQRMNLELARYVVEHQPGSLLGPDGRPDPLRMKALAEHVMAINPAVEVYLLDETGRVLAHALDATPADNPVGVRVDMAPMQRLLRAAAERRETGQVRLPVLGTDPRERRRLNTFTVAPVSGPGGKMGYLYIVLNGNQAQRVAASLSNSDALRAMALGAALATLLAGVVLAIVWQQLTRPLRRLTQEVRAFRIEGEPALADPDDGDEIGTLRRAVRSMQRRITAQFASLEDGDRQRRELVSNISHDLRTPLSRLRLALEMSGAERGAAEAMGADIEEIDEVIAQFLAFAKDEDEPRTPGDLRALLGELAESYRRREHKVRVRECEFGPVRFAPVAMRRAVSNLVDNALRYAGGEIEIAARRERDRLVVEVLDRGPGVPAAETERLKRPFTRLDESRSGPGRAGLGLAIVERIARAHGGRLELAPRPGGGLAARIELPF